ncbi:hypothetical protein ACFOGI_05850 [Virgibacillus xinjiangensis]|uniref:HNH nuclease domain-containing protein n=1 Tax=Virgibacillus xinjiangensis TaxID=393090 RepID=A0ABV7CUJ4_9BACI
MAKKYLNQYEMAPDHVLLYISGLKHEATLKIEKDDYESISSKHWGLMAVGKKGNEKIVPYTTVNRASVPLGRWLLDIHHPEKKVEHFDRDNHNFLRENLYVTEKSDYRLRHSLKDDGKICGVFEIKRNGRVTGYKVEYKEPETAKKKFKCFTASKCNGLTEAKKEAFEFRMDVLKKKEIAC